MPLEAFPGDRPQRLSGGPATVLASGPATCLADRFSERPPEAFPGGSPHRLAGRPAFSKWLWLIPPLMCFWTNAHGGYLAGMAILMAWLGLDGVELLIRRDERLWSTVRHHAILFAATVAACMVNPYGLELHTWMLSSLGRPRPEISEWAPLPLFTLDGMPFWCLVLGAFLCLKRTDQPFRWPGMIVMALLSWQAIKHHRHAATVAVNRIA